jgi:hypothetical protein
MVAPNTFLGQRGDRNTRIAFAFLLLLGLFTPAWAGNPPISVTAFADSTNPGDGLTSLHEAILSANSTPGLDQIDLPGGTYALSIAGAGEELAATGEDPGGDSLLGGA